MRSLAALCLAAMACGGGGAPKEPEKPKAAPVDERKAEKDAKGLITEIVQSVEHAKTDGLMALLAEPLVVFGPRRTDASQSRSDALVALRATFDAMGKDAKPSVKSDGLSVVASPGGNSAWVVDVMDVEGKPMSAMMVLSNEDDFWVVVAAGIAHTPSMKEVRAELKKDAIVPPGMPGFAKVSDSAEGAVDRFKKGLADPTVWAEDLAKRSDAVVVGPSEGDITRGKKDIEKLWKKRAKVNLRHTSAGEVTAMTTRDGELAWVTAPVVRFADDDEPLPLRLFSVFEKTDGKWTMIALQESLALDEPGIGANFKKVTPPSVKEEEPPPKPKEEPKKKTTTKKKKKKKSKKSDD
ncbi:MAG TPA: nuclear transport factor 2 family protein [Kofleriaceae bacterium]|nr:nuclear transport factor 2 family protein [Kofleriaceae bacterium]